MVKRRRGEGWSSGRSSWRAAGGESSSPEASEAWPASSPAIPSTRSGSGCSSRRSEVGLRRRRSGWWGASRRRRAFRRSIEAWALLLPLWLFRYLSVSTLFLIFNFLGVLFEKFPILDRRFSDFPSSFLRCCWFLVLIWFYEMLLNIPCFGFG